MFGEELEAAGRSRIRFCHDVWCGDRALKWCTQTCICIAVDRDKLVFSLLFSRGEEENRYWNLRFIHNFHGWLLEGLDSFMDLLLYSHILLRVVLILWDGGLLAMANLVCIRIMNVWQVLIEGTSYWSVFGITKYQRMLYSLCACRHWIKFWLKKKMDLVNWCWMCKYNGESMDPLLLCCLVAYYLWSLVFFFIWGAIGNAVHGVTRLLLLERNVWKA